MSWTPADYVLRAKTELGDVHMSDRLFGEHLAELAPKRAPFSPSAISNARYNDMSDEIARRVAKVLGLPPGEVIFAARIAREQRPEVKQDLEAWMRVVKKALASVPSKAANAFVACAVALGQLLLQPMY